MYCPLKTVNAHAESYGVCYSIQLEAKGERLVSGAVAAKAESGYAVIQATTYTNGGEHAIFDIYKLSRSPKIERR